MRSQIVLFLSLILSLLNGVYSFAQSVGDTKGPPAPKTNRTPPFPDQSMPIDDNIFILLVIGVVLGVCFFWQKRAVTKKPL